ncbi:MAG: Kelch repeat-containing protein [Frankiales bacterium]|nr:Kelch repeat-containing protein [Frankiales bacterium]
MSSFHHSGAVRAGAGRARRTLPLVLVLGLVTAATLSTVPGGVAAAHTTAGVPLAALEADVPAVAPPTGLEGAGGDKAVGLTWTRSTSTGVAGYSIYRSTSLPVPVTGTPVNSTLATGQTYLNSGRTNGTTYYYVVVAVATDGTRSQPTDPVSVRPAAPAAPTGATLTWTSKAAAAIARAEAGAAISHGLVYVFGGQYSGTTQTLRSDRYDPGTDTWTRIRDLPELVTHAPVVADGTTLWILGGYVGLTKKDTSSRVWKYDTLTDTYTAGPPLPAPRGAGGAVLVGRQLHYFTGAVRTDSVGGPTVDHADHWVLDLDGDGTWLSSVPVPNPRNHTGVAALGDTVYLVGGQHGENEATAPQKEVDALDLTTGTWRRVADLPVPRGHISASTFVWNGKVLALGASVLGALPSSTVYEYDPVTDAWTTRTNLMEAVRSPIAVLFDDKILVSGGRAAAGPTARTWSGSLTPPPPPPAGSWSTASPLPSALLDAGGAALGTTVYVVGGKTSTAHLSTVRAYNTVTGVWTTRASLPGSRVENPALVTYQGKLYAFGGSTGAFSGAVRTAYRYDPITNAWTRLADMAVARGGAAAAVVGTEAWVVGGMDSTGASLRSTERLDLTTGTWSAGPDLTTARDNPGAAAIDGGLLVFGGRTRLANGTEVTANLASTEFLATGGTAWTAMAPMLTGRRTMAVGVIDGRAVAAGGEKQPSGATWPQTEEYDPVSGAWLTLAPMKTPRHGAAAAVVDGKLYVIGGGTVGGSSYSAVNEVLTR